MSRRQTLTNDILFGSTAPAQESVEPPAAPAPTPAAAPSASPSTSAAALLAERPGLGQAVEAAVTEILEGTAPVSEPLDVASETAGQAAETSKIARRKPLAAGERRPSGRERHDEKITVYLSAEELDGIDIAQLDLRRRFGIRVDRGRIVREAVAVLLADLDARGESSTVVKRLSGRR